MTAPGIKYTNQRVEILGYIRDNCSHPTADDVYEAVRKKLPRIGRATVYQNLRFLAEKGMIREVSIKGVARFEPATGSHHHVVCRKCGIIFDHESKELTEHAMEVAKGVKGARIDAACTTFYGVCDKCVRREKNGRRK